MVAALHLRLRVVLSLSALALGALSTGCSPSFGAPRDNIVVRRPDKTYKEHLDQPQAVAFHREPPPDFNGLHPRRCQALCADVAPGRAIVSCRQVYLGADLSKRVHPDPPEPSNPDPPPPSNPDPPEPSNPDPPEPSVDDRRRQPPDPPPNEWFMCTFAPGPPSSSNAQETRR